MPLLLTILILGIVEGVTEFIPVSSTGHLILASELLGYNPAQWAVFNVVIQLGAILAVLVLYWRTFWAVLIGLFHGKVESWRFVRNVLVAFIPSAVLGFLLIDRIEALLESAKVVAWALLIGGIAMLVIERTAPQGREKGVADISLGKAIGVGLIQCLAMIPGVSRSGATILGGLSLGIERRTAAEFSFFLAIPTMLGATTLQLLKHRDELGHRRRRRHRARLPRLLRRRDRRHQMVHGDRHETRLRALRLVPDRGRRRGARLADVAVRGQIARRVELVSIRFPDADICSGGGHDPEAIGRQLGRPRVREEALMRRFLISLALLGGGALAASPAAAQPREEQTLRGGAEAVRQAAPMVDRSADRALEMDIGPLLDALHPYSPRGRHMTLRDMARRDDPDFDAKLRRSIYRGSARAAATLDAMATAAPSIRQSLRQMEAAIAGAMIEARRPLPPGAYAAPVPDDDLPPPPADEDEDDGAPW